MGYAGVLVDPFTGYVPEKPVLGPKIGFKAPWRIVKSVYVAAEAVHMWTESLRCQRVWGKGVGDYPAIEALAKDGLQAWVDLTVRWHINPDYAPKLVRAYPDLDCEDKLIIPEIRRAARDVVSRYEAVMLAETRQEIGYEILQRLQENLDADPTIGGAFTIDEVYVRNIRLPQKFVEAIQEKLAAQQRMIAAQYERNTTLIPANGTRFIVILSPQGGQLPLLYPIGEG